MTVKANANALKSGEPDWLAEIQPAMREAPPSGIVEVFNYGRGRQGLIPLWVGEGDRPTPPFIAEAAKASLDRGETFYTYQRGVPELRQAIARYMTRVYGAEPGGGDFSPERFFVTIGGMHALEIATRLTLAAGDEALIPSPAWPNFAGAVTLTGARPVFTPLERGATRWRLDVERLAAAITPATRAIFINSPANPTGFVATHEELAAALALARRHNLWIIADEIYGRLTFSGARAPSFHDLMTADDKILFLQTLSKNWAMTGWRIGWLEAPPALGAVIENLVQFTTSGVPVFAQRAATVALDEGETYLAGQLARMHEARDILAHGLAATGRVQFARPDAAFYLFCAVAGEADSRALALRLVDEAGVGAAPGSAFGPGGETYLRLCFARAPEEIAEATRRLANWLMR
ncbi:MAG: pyridoxal phosphate-dependent aminotransferase [Bradyrhizobium sp.]|nr:MAG: pyridoxal phosphate-dependent aminotransferase [Bradyrhizobium sp.]